MSVLVTRLDRQWLLATVSDRFEYGEARDLLRTAQALRSSSANDSIIVDLLDVHLATTCAAALLIVLAEEFSGRLHVRLDRCSPSVRMLLESEILNYPFPPDSTSLCRTCLASGSQDCS